MILFNTLDNIASIGRLCKVISSYLLQLPECKAYLLKYFTDYSWPTSK